MVSSTLCSLVSLYGMLKHSWLSFKLLKDFQLHQGIEQREDGEAKAHDQAFLEGRMREMRRILQFWTVFAIYSLYEFYLEVFVFWIPFYYSLKLVAVVWLMLPETQGAATVFSLVVEPVMIRHSEWFRSVFLPAVHSFVCESEAALVGSVKCALSKEKLLLAIDHFENILRQLRGELHRRENHIPEEKSAESNDNEGIVNRDATKGQPWVSAVSSTFDGVVGITRGKGEGMRNLEKAEKQEDFPSAQADVVELLEVELPTETEYCSIGEYDLSSEFDSDDFENKDDDDTTAETKDSSDSPSKFSPKYVDTVLGILKGIRDNSPLKPRTTQSEEEDSPSSTERVRKSRKLPNVTQSSRPMTRGYSKTLKK